MEAFMSEDILSLNGNNSGDSFSVSSEDDKLGLLQDGNASDDDEPGLPGLRDGNASDDDDDDDDDEAMCQSSNLQSDFKSLAMLSFEDLRSIMNKEAPVCCEVQRT
jgi:hypothetical protein